MYFFNLVLNKKIVFRFLPLLTEKTGKENHLNCCPSSICDYPAHSYRYKEEEFLITKYLLKTLNFSNHY